MLLSVSSYAGNGSSGGGHIYGDQVNPWFLQNTKNVSYCLEIDANFSNLDEERVKEIITNAFLYWKNEFSNSDLKQYVNSDFEPEPRVATQKFQLESCGPDTGIRFQFGTLSDEQKEQLGNIKQIIASAYRTSYDQVNLKGNGFIYIAPEKGNMRPVSSFFAKDPWSYGNNNVLLYTLIHELGHVFGLPDLTSSRRELMSRHFVETLTSKKDNYYRNSDRYLSLKGFKFMKPLGFDGKYSTVLDFSMSSSSTSTSTSSSASTNININKKSQKMLEFDYCGLLDINCQGDELHLHFKGNGHKVELYTKPSMDGVKTLAGVFHLSSGQVSTHMESSEFTPSVWLSKKQKVFKVRPYMLENTMWLYALPRQGMIRNTIYRSTSGAEKKVIFNFLNPISFEIGTVSKGEYIPNIFDTY